MIVDDEWDEIINGFSFNNNNNVFIRAQRKKYFKLLNFIQIGKNFFELSSVKFEFCLKFM